MLTLYFISGLGSDGRIFRKLELENCEIKYINWVRPEKSESLESYVERLTDQINSDGEFVLIGLSFGGIIAQELALRVKPKKVILISSIKHQNEKPLYLKLIKRFCLYKIIPFSFIKYASPLFYRTMGAFTNEERKLVKEFVQKTDKSLFNWSIKQIALWEKTETDTGLYHIHGDADRVLPLKNIKTDYIVKEGNHFMVYNKSGEISNILLDIIANC